MSLREAGAIKVKCQSEAGASSISGILEKSG